MNALEKLAEIQQIMDDYQEELWNDTEVKDNLMYLLGRYISTGQDLSDEELVILKDFLQQKIDKYVKEKAN